MKGQKTINIKPRYIIGFIIILIILIVLFKLLPLYDKPINLFLQKQTQLISYSSIGIQTNDGLILIDNGGKETIKINSGINYFPLNIDIEQKISFPSKKEHSDTFIFIQISGNFLKIYPQSSIYIKNGFITIIQGKTDYLIMDDRFKMLFTGKTLPVYLQNPSKEINEILSDQKEKNKKYIIKQYGGNIILNDKFDYFINKLLIILSKISPLKYSKNLKNYKDFKEYLGETNGTSNLKMKDREKTNINNDILKQINKSRSKLFNSF